MLNFAHGARKKFPGFLVAIMALAVGFSLLGCEHFKAAKNGDMEISQACTQAPLIFIPERAQSDDAIIGDVEITTVGAGACMVNNEETQQRISAEACVRIGRTCEGRTCSPNKVCINDAQIGDPIFIRLDSCMFDPSTGICTCDLIIPAGENIRCGCVCDDPST